MDAYLIWLLVGLALVVAIGWALLLEYMNPRVRTIRDLDYEPGVPVLGAIPIFRPVSKGLLR